MAGRKRKTKEDDLESVSETSGEGASDIETEPLEITEQHVSSLHLLLNSATDEINRLVTENSFLKKKVDALATKASDLIKENIRITALLNKSDLKK